MTGDQRTVLVVVAHPDDEILGCGGTLCKLIAEGARVYIVYLSEGVNSRAASSALSRIDRLASRDAVVERLRVSGVYQFDLPDNSFDSVPFLGIVQLLEEVILQTKPSLIFTHFRHDLNIDHRLAFNAVLTAVRPQAGTSVKGIYSFEVPSSTEWAFNANDNFSPNYFVDISNFMEEKKSLLALYRAEMRDYPHPRSFENVESLARVRGATIGLIFAEGFSMIWSRDDL